jgi:UDP-N-acetylglucosamine--N-acetylmuramyl-(pentapeptide) pyrophosphoryl-undecaprenol N-acetylglucosamine transferase
MCTKKLLKNYNILHITGKNNVNKQLINLKNYVQVEFLQNIQDFYATSDLVISRAGSNVIFELLALKKPMLLIPLSKQSSRGDQILNAKYFFQKGFARILYQENLSTKTLQTKIFQTLNTKSALVTNMTSITETSGNQNILNQILKFSN